MEILRIYALESEVMSRFELGGFTYEYPKCLESDLPMIQELDFRGKPYKIHVQNRTPQDPSWFSFYDEATVRDRDFTIGPGDVFIDVGSAYGSYLLPALASGATCAIAFNPNAEENLGLGRNVELNGWVGRVIVYHTGLYSSEGALEDLGQDFKPGSEVPPKYFKVRPLDEFLHRNFVLSPSFEKIWIKLDVEGAEVEVLKGATRFLTQYRDKIHLLIENHVFKISDIDVQVREFLTGMDFVHMRTTKYHGVSHSLYIPQAEYLKDRHQAWDGE